MKTVYDEFKDMVRFNQVDGQKAITYDRFLITKKIYYSHFHEAKMIAYEMCTTGWQTTLACQRYDYYDNVGDIIHDVAYEMCNYFEEYGARIEKDLINGYRR